MPAPSNPQLAVLRQWVEKAEHDLTAARQIQKLGKAAPTDTICFHAQQCVEKYLKAALVNLGIPFAKTHDIEVLMKLIPPKHRPAMTPTEQNYSPVMRSWFDIRKPDWRFLCANRAGRWPSRGAFAAKCAARCPGRRYGAPSEHDSSDQSAPSSRASSAQSPIPSLRPQSLRSTPHASRPTATNPAWASCCTARFTSAAFGFPDLRIGTASPRHFAFYFCILHFGLCKFALTVRGEARKNHLRRSTREARGRRSETGAGEKSQRAN